MNTDPEVNVIVFEIERQKGLMRITGRGPTRAANCIQSVWEVFEQHPDIKDDLQGGKMVRIFSEWEPSPDDRQYLTSTFPSAVITYAFDRPEDGDWDQAMKRVVIGASAEKQSANEKKRSWWKPWQ